MLQDLVCEATRKGARHAVYRSGIVPMLPSEHCGEGVSQPWLGSNLITQTVTNAIEQLTRSMQILKLNVASLVTGTNAFLVS
jgi:hypothetical protein